MTDKYGKYVGHNVPEVKHIDVWRSKSTSAAWAKQHPSAAQFCAAKQQIATADVLNFWTLTSQVSRFQSIFLGCSLL